MYLQLGTEIIILKNNLAGGVICGTLPAPEPEVFNENNWNFQGGHLESSEIWIIKLFSGYILQMQIWRWENFLWQDWWQHQAHGGRHEILPRK